METYFQELLKHGGPYGILVGAVVIIVGLALRGRALDMLKPASAPAPASETSRLEDLSKEVANVNQRLTSVERDLRDLPTREEIHALNVAQTQFSERLIALDRTATTTSRAVTRIEDYMIQVSRRSQEP